MGEATRYVIMAILLTQLPMCRAPEVYGLVKGGVATSGLYIVLAYSGFGPAGVIAGISRPSLYIDIPESPLTCFRVAGCLFSVQRIRWTDARC